MALDLGKKFTELMETKRTALAAAEEQKVRQIEKKNAAWTKATLVYNKLLSDISGRINAANLGNSDCLYVSSNSVPINAESGKLPRVRFTVSPESRSGSISNLDCASLHYYFIDVSITEAGEVNVSLISRGENTILRKGAADLDAVLEALLGEIVKNLS